jgi:hypothetical protein
MNVSPARPNHREILAINVLCVRVLVGFEVSELAILVCSWDDRKRDGKEAERIVM